MAVTGVSALSAFVSGLNQSTEIRAPHIVYSWASTTTAVFTFVRRSDQSDGFQWLAQVSSRAQTSVGMQFPSFDRRQIGGQWVAHPRVVQAERSFTSTPVGFDNVTDAVRHFRSGVSGAQFRQVASIRLSGPNAVAVQTVQLSPPRFMAHVN